MESSRYIPNPYTDYQPPYEPLHEQNIKSLIKVQMEKIINILSTKSPPNIKNAISSNGNKRMDISMYTGTGANIYLYYKLYRYYVKTNASQNFLESAITLMDKALNTNLKILQQDNSKLSQGKLESPSFFMGPSGIYTMACMIYYHLHQQNKIEMYWKLLLEQSKYCFTKHSEDELLYGNAGYLWCLLFLKKLNPTVFNSDSSIIQIVDNLKSQGLKIGKDKLLFRFPRKEGKYYLGAAHGLMGILYILMKAIEAVPSLKNDNVLMNSLESSCEFMASLQNGSGNFPSSYGKANDQLVHFCHGAAGSIHFLLECHKLFNQDDYLIRAKKAGDVIWQRGILKKGNGLCHGITGNAYSQYFLYKYTSDLKYKYRALKFAEASFDEQILEITKDYQDPGRKVIGIPDRPYSLMEGMAGTAVFYLDFLNEDEMTFPGYEI